MRTVVIAVLLSAGAGLMWAAQSRPERPIVVVLETQKGTIEIEVDTVRAPVTAGNFLKYVDGRLFDGGEFHRSVRPDTESRTDYPIQVIQARRVPGTAGFPPIALERTSVTGLRHVDGAISMGRGGTDTATSDFFICIGDQPELDFGGRRNADGQGFGAFGRVVAGMDVVRAIQAGPVAPNRPTAEGAPPAIPNSQTLAPTVRIVRAHRK